MEEAKPVKPKHPKHPKLRGGDAIIGCSCDDCIRALNQRLDTILDPNRIGR